MKKLLVGLMLIATSQVIAGGTSGVGTPLEMPPPCQFDCMQEYFENHVEVKAAIAQLAALGFSHPVANNNINQYAGTMNCVAVNPEAKWISCDKLYVFSRAFIDNRPCGLGEIRAVTAVVKMSVRGNSLSIINNGIDGDDGGPQPPKPVTCPPPPTPPTPQPN